jgi:hypothetical protein
LTELQTNVLFYGDNLDILRRYLPDASVDLVYLDPPFNSNRDYNVIFRDESGNATDAQLLAFEDTWHWGPSAEATHAYLTNTARHARQKGLNIIRKAMIAIPPKPITASAHGRPLDMSVASSAPEAGSAGGCRRLPTAYGSPPAFRSSLK